MSRVKEILKLVEHLPPFPEAARRVMELLVTPGTDVRALAEVIQDDRVITDNVVRICNAPYFGSNRKISSLPEALEAIDDENLKDIITISSISRFYKGVAGQGYQLEHGELWCHSVAVGIMVKLLADRIDEVDNGAAFTAGLLHDIGKSFLSSFVSDAFERIMARVGRDKSSFAEAEKEILGITHAELGGIILGKWGFPAGIQQAVVRHHDPDAFAMEPLTALVALSNALVLAMGIGVGANGLATKVRGEGLRRFGITRARLDLCMANLLQELEQAEELLQL